MKTKTLRTIGFNYSYKYLKSKKQKRNPIFIINGAFQNMNTWTPIVSLLNDRHSVILADLPGWGQSDLLPSLYDFSVYNQFIFDILKKEEIDKINILSSSFGTLIATSFAQSYPELVDKLILCSPITEIKDSLQQSYPEMQEIIKSRDARALSEFLCRIGLINCEAGEKGMIDSFEILLKKFVINISRLDANHLGKFMANTNRILNFPGSDLSKISSIKTLILSGVHDRFTSPDDCESVYEQFENCKLKFVPKSDHLFLFEQPLYAIKKIDKFLSKKSVKTKSYQKALNVA